jgi:hypothetical protein
VSAEDVQDAVVLIDDQDGDFEKKYDTGDNHIKATPPPKQRDDESDHEHAVRYLNTYITENHIDDRDTITDNSVNQMIDTGGGDFEQELNIDSTVASGDGAVAAGGDIEDSTIVSGNGNQVGDGNVNGDGNVAGTGNRAVTGDDSTTAFGSGDATETEVGGNVRVGEGAVFSAGGDVDVDNTDESVNDSFNNRSNNSTNDSDNLDLEIDASVSDSGNDNSENSLSGSFNEVTDNSRENTNNVSLDA